MTRRTPSTLRLPVLAALAAGFVLLDKPAQACGPDPYLGSICYFAFNFCPTGYVPANGGVVNGNDALYSLLGQSFGSNPNQGATVVPNLQGKAVVGAGVSQQSGNSASYAQQLGSETVTLLPMQTLHTHDFAGTIEISQVTFATSTPPSDPSPDGSRFATGIGYYNSDPAGSVVGSSLRVKLPPIPYPVPPGPAPGSMAISAASAGQTAPTPVPLRPPQIVLTACIATTGTYPPRQ